MLLTIILLIAMLAVFATTFFLALVIVMSEVSEWINEADIHLFEDEKDDRIKMDNTEYDWGHDIRNYGYEDEEEY